MKKFRLIVEEPETALYPESIKSSRDAADLCRPLFDGLDIEKFYVIALNRSNKPLGTIEISSGGITATIVDPKIVFSRLLNIPTCCQFIATHNHPGGNASPSEADKELTKNLKAAGKMLDLTLLDHVIIGESYFSFADEGML